MQLLRQKLFVMRTPRKWLADWEILQFRGVLTTTVLTQACRSVGILSNLLEDFPGSAEVAAIV